MTTKHFDRETLKVLRQALENAAYVLPERERTQERKAILASSILSLANAGVRDLSELSAGAIRRLQPKP
jgi:hypothetical protein